MLHASPRRLTVHLALLVLFLAACATTPDALPADTPETPLDSQFAQAAETYGVPSQLLKAVGHAETRWQMVESELPGEEPAYGIMALGGEQLSRAAALAGLPAAEVRTDAGANILAGAALLSAYADELGLERSDLAAWAPAVARFSEITSPDWQAYYVHTSVYGAIREGVTGGEATLEPYPDMPAPDFREPPTTLTAQQQTGEPYYPPLVWNPSPNHRSRGDTAVMVIIHTCEGGYAGCVSTLINGGVSAHYVVNEEGTEVSQLVDESRAAYHIAASYRSSLNGGTFPEREGDPANNFTIGIEHAGFASGTFSDGLLDTSAQLICGISKKNNIPLDAFRIVGHGKLQPENRTDPGPNWPWEDYLARASELCGSEPPPPPPPGCDLTWETQRQGDSGTPVKALQHLLTAAGRSTTADGSFGPATASSVKGFQSAKGLAVDGVVGPQTWTALTSSHVLREGSRGEAVKAVQVAVGTAADGVFGPATKAAVIDYQRANGLAADGVVGKNTWATISGGQGCP